MTADTTTLSYWLNWRFSFCALFILTSMVVAAIIIWKFEGRKRSENREVENRKESPGILYEDETWKTCLEGIHPAWLLGFRVFAFLMLLALLMANAVISGGGIFYFYTQWTFTLVTIYFGFGSAVSIDGCRKHCRKACGDRSNHISLDSEQGTYVPPTIDEIADVSSNQSKHFDPREAPYHPSIAGPWTYAFQIIYQICAGAVMLTDSVFWLIIFPFLMPIREFIKNVYVDRKYAGGKSSDKPPRDMQSHRNHEDEVRRASSYHSYSQSPPYDYQYEDRRYGKQVAAALSRKPGSDRGHYVGKVSSFVYSPGRLSDQMFEDRFANEGSAPRVSDYSVSSGGDPFASGTGSPNYRKDIGFSSPTFQPPRDVLSEDTHHQMINPSLDPSSQNNGGGIPPRQRTKSIESYGSFDGNAMPVKSCSSGIGIGPDVVSEREQIDQFDHTKTSTIMQSSVPVNYGALDLFNTPEASASPPLDFFQLPATSSESSKDLFQPTAVSSMPPGDLYKPPSSTPSIDLFAEIAEQHPATSFDGKSPELPVPKNEGWATFDTPQPAASDPVSKNLLPAVMPSDEDLSVKFDQQSSINTTMQWSPFENFSAFGDSSAMSTKWQDGHEVQAPPVATGTQSWNAFNDSVESLPLEPQVVAYEHMATTDEHLGLAVSENHDNYGIQTADSHIGFPAATLPSENGIAPLYAPSMNPLPGEKETQAADLKPTNPFDLPFDSELEQSDMFFDMSSLQSTLPNAQLPSTFLGVSQPWLPQNPTPPQGGLVYMSGQTPSSQLPNVPAQGPVASIGGNPFA